MPFTHYALDNYFAQEISALSECNAPDLAEHFAEVEPLMDNFIFNSIFTFPLKTEYKPYIFGIIRRVQMALVEYQNGRTLLLLYLNESKKNISLYFQALSHFEIAVTQLYQAYEFWRKLGKKIESKETNLFKTGDGSSHEKLNRLYNISKHLEPSTIPEGNLHHVWISNNGICASGVTMSFTELAELVKEYVALANAFSNPNQDSIP
ncbi:hypothetical protein [Microcoleus vaginatus]|uniref:hypothetical protein n=1 Tax=Microcoleus vaginatus TaxID=119532 RepID=UPI001684218D|nr:hypothetical protein [Microcoleus sp. FACHB-DQ6]MBD1887441.1 hypothetical protein [Microcoleus sp. FACHB-84]MBD2008898.1 hypothetical protein [Microcoleus sp. FACHB-45]